jgi:hypothetical protein
VNALSYIAGAAVLSKGKNFSKAAVIFEVFDLHNEAVLAEHAVVMMLMSAITGCIALAKLDKNQMLNAEKSLLSRCRKAVSHIFVALNIEAPCKGQSSSGPCDMPHCVGSKQNQTNSAFK